MAKVTYRMMNIAESLGEALWLDGDISMETAKSYNNTLTESEYAEAIQYAHNLDLNHQEYEAKEKLLTLHEQMIEEETDDYNDLYRDL